MSNQLLFGCKKHFLNLFTRSKYDFSREQSEDSLSTSIARCESAHNHDDASLRCEGSTDIDRELSSLHLSQSIDSNMECSLVATGPDPYDKLKVEMGE